MSNEIENIQQYFKDNKYVVLKNFLDPNTVGLIYRYAITKVMAMDCKYQFKKDKYDIYWDGEWGDPQAPSSYSNYGDALMDTVLTASLPSISNYTGLDLIPNYTYWRFYQQNEVLEKHIDRNSCEISTTLCLGYDTSNLKDTEKNYNWPIYIENAQGQEIPINLHPGDMLIYRGCEIPHWRDSFKGLSQAQVFLHYNDRNTNPVPFDGRPMIGVPKHTNNYIFGGKN